VARPKKPPSGAASLSLHILADLEVRLLETVCRYGPYHSPVSLAADLWMGHGDDWHVANADWVEWICYGLCDQGLLILREHDPVVPGSDGTYNYGLHISYIRATREGFDLLDFPPQHYVVGSRLALNRDAMLRPGDTTEFRFHNPSAVGGEIERMTIGEHLATYPSHRRSRSGW
jgi:hypothetical protein